MLLAETLLNLRRWNDCAQLLLWWWFIYYLSWMLLIWMQQIRFLNRQKGKRWLNNLPTHPWWSSFKNTPKTLLNCTISWSRAAFAYVMRHCAFVHTHTLPAHLQIFTLLFHWSLLRDLCVCIELLRINKVYIQRWMATCALLFLMAWEHLMSFNFFLIKEIKAL